MLTRLNRTTTDALSNRLGAETLCELGCPIAGVRHDREKVRGRGNALSRAACSRPGIDASLCATREMQAKMCTVQRMTAPTPTYRDLAPGIFRQRFVIEGTRQRPITDSEIRTYLRRLSDVCGMIVLLEPVTHRSERYGWAGWIHWETSGAHFYAWDEPGVFFSIDVYTCKPVVTADAVEFTRACLDADEIVSHEWH